MSDDERRGSSRQGERAAGIYALLLRLYPRSHRQAFGEQMLQAFRDHYRDTVETRREHAWWFWLDALADLVHSVWRERRATWERGLRVSWIWKHFGVVAGLLLWEDWRSW